MGTPLTLRGLLHASWSRVALLGFCQRRPTRRHLVLLLLQQLLHLTEKLVALGSEL